MKGWTWRPVSSFTVLTLLSYPQNVLELTLYDKDFLDSDKISLLLFDLSSLQLGQPYTENFTLNQQVSSAWANSK